jgi:hypothetical protein
MGHPLFHGRNRRLAGRAASADLTLLRNPFGPARQTIGRGAYEKQVENSPEIDTHQPVSRQHEAAYLGYYGYPNYWDGPYMWGPAFYPAVWRFQ